MPKIPVPWNGVGRIETTKMMSVAMAKLGWMFRALLFKNAIVSSVRMIPVLRS